MARTYLKGKKFKVPTSVINYLKEAFNHYNRTDETNEEVDKRMPGFSRCKNLINKKFVTLEQLERIIHDIKYSDDKNSLYYLSGGKTMLDWGRGILDHYSKINDIKQDPRLMPNDDINVDNTVFNKIRVNNNMLYEVIKRNLRNYAK